MIGYAKHSILILFANVAPCAIAQTEASNLSSLKRIQRTEDSLTATYWQRLMSWDEQNKDRDLKEETTYQRIVNLTLAKSGFPTLAMANALNGKTERLKSQFYTIGETYSSIEMMEGLSSILPNLSAILKSDDGATYFRAVKLINEKKWSEALLDLDSIQASSRYFAYAAYKRAFVHFQNGNPKESEIVLRSLIAFVKNPSSTVTRSERALFRDRSYLLLGRILYESRRFKESVASFRKVDRKSELFPTALADQSWSLFMAGLPKHSLGAIHSVQSPYFASLMFPEQSLLKVFNFYWICRYADAAYFLDKFEKTEAVAASRLENNPSRQGAEPAFDVLADTLKNESHELDVRLLRKIADDVKVKKWRRIYAQILEEGSNLSRFGVNGSHDGVEVYQNVLGSLERQVKSKLGEVFSQAVNSTLSDFQKLKRQVAFLRIELLMSEKERLLGRNLHSETKIASLSDKNKISGWGQAETSWQANDLGEYWLDELGSYIYEVSPQCVEVN